MNQGEQVQVKTVTFFPEQAQARLWNEGLNEVLERIGRHFDRKGPRESAGVYVRGLLAPVERKNGWQLAEQAGHQTPYRLQYLLSQADWGAGDLRDDLRDYIVEHLGDEQAVLAVDETGFLKKGTESVGVQRQYTGTAGRIENSQVGVFMAYVSPKGRALMDRKLYLPKSWTDDDARLKKANVPEEIGFATKPELAREMVEAAIEAEVPFAWVTGDEVYGQSPAFRDWLMTRRVPFVLAVPSTMRVCRKGNESIEAREVAKRLWRKTWKRLSAGDGTKGKRLYDWALIKLRLPETPAYGAWLLVRRNIEDPTDKAYYVVYGPQDATIETIVRVAGARWGVEDCFEQAKGEVGLDQYEVRGFDGWYRHITLAMYAHAFLAAMRAAAPEQTGPAEPGAEAAAKGGLQSSPPTDSLCRFKQGRGLSCR